MAKKILHNGINYQITKVEDNLHYVWEMIAYKSDKSQKEYLYPFHAVDLILSDINNEPEIFTKLHGALRCKKIKSKDNK